MPADDYVMQKQIGKGAYGTAHIVQHKTTGVRYVLKKVRLARQTPQERQSSINELYMQSNLQHRNIVQYVESWVEAGCIVCLLLELCESGDLLCQIKLRAPGALYFSEEMLQECAFQLLSALAFLHTHHVAHRDVKSSNVLITADAQLKLADFGLATVLEEASGYTTNVVVGTPNYMCPDVLQSKAYGVASDIWGLGCVLYELSALKPAFSALNMAGLVKKVTSSTAAPLPAQYSESWRSLIRTMLTKEVAERPSAVELLALPEMQAAAKRIEDKFGGTCGHINVPLSPLPPGIARLEQQFKQQELDEARRRSEAKAKQKAAMDKYGPKMGPPREETFKKPPSVPLKPHQPRTALDQGAGIPKPPVPSTTSAGLPNTSSSRDLPRARRATFSNDAPALHAVASSPSVAMPLRDRPLLRASGTGTAPTSAKPATRPSSVAILKPGPGPGVHCSGSHAAPPPAGEAPTHVTGATDADSRTVYTGAPHSPGVASRPRSAPPTPKSPGSVPAS